MEASSPPASTSPVVIHALLIFTVVGIFLALLPSNFARLVALGLLVLAALIMVLLALRNVIREGDDVEVKTRGRLHGRRGTVVNVLEPASHYEVKLHETEEQDKMTPSETVKLYWHELEKHR